MKLLLALTFFTACSTSIHFFCRYFIWLGWKINPTHFNNPVTERDVLVSNLLMYFSLILWTIIFYFVVL